MYLVRLLSHGCSFIGQMTSGESVIFVAGLNRAEAAAGGGEPPWLLRAFSLALAFELPPPV